jgi:hypothetical protein
MVYIFLLIYIMNNFYEEVPKAMLDNAENPNFESHRISLPFRMCVSAPSGSGKTNFVLNLIKKMSEGEGTFKDITIVTKNKDEPLYNYLSKKAPDIVIKEGMSGLPILDKMEKKENHLVIVDDLLLEKDQSPIVNYYIRCRKLNCSIVYLSQSYFDIPSLIRKNCSYMVFLKIGGLREVKDILRNFGLGVSKEQLMNMYDYATDEKFGCLILDLEAKRDEKFRKNFLEILDPSMFGEDEE